MEDMDKLLDINEAAKLLKLNPETLRRWDEKGKLIAVKVNERGDRRYLESDILKLMKNNQLIQYKGYSISWDSDGFLSMPANFGLIGRIIAQTENRWVGFAFALSGSSLFERTGLKDKTSEKAIEKIKEYIDKNEIFDGDVFTFEFRNGYYVKVQNPEWWQGKYSKTLVEGLRVLAEHTVPVTFEQKAWRVILHFNSKQGDYWLPNTIGKKESPEYLVWLDSKELIKNNLPNTSKGAEVLAVNFGMKRFEETKDKNGDRDISRINENNAACFDGKCIKDRLLPDSDV